MSPLRPRDHECTLKPWRETLRCSKVHLASSLRVGHTSKAWSPLFWIVPSKNDYFFLVCMPLTRRRVPSLGTLTHPKDLKLNPSTFPYVPCTLLNYLSTRAHLKGTKPQPSAFMSAHCSLPLSLECIVNFGCSKPSPLSFKLVTFTLSWFVSSLWYMSVFWSLKAPPP